MTDRLTNTEIEMLPRYYCGFCNAATNHHWKYRRGYDNLICNQCGTANCSIRAYGGFFRETKVCRQLNRIYKGGKA